jgi:hypothetical protein
MSVDTETGRFLWYWGTTALLAIALYFPVLRFITVKRIRRLESELKRESTAEERGAARKKSRLIAVLIAVGFAYMFNTALFGP